MPTGFVYVVRTVGKDYQQPSFRAVPTWHKDRIYFGPCKKGMRPRMQAGDVVFGISPSGVFPRRVVFSARIAERMSFAEAYERFPDLRGPAGPINVRPAEIPGPGFPDSHYEHIPGGNHPDEWRGDLRTPALDAFFACEKAGDCLGRWLGPNGPAVKGPILDFLRTCQVWGNAGFLSPQNISSTEDVPIRHGRLYTGLHLETDRPDDLIRLVCGAGTKPAPDDGLFPADVPTARKPGSSRSCS